MGKIAFLFSGQGAQYTGMGRELWAQSPAARQVFETADGLRPGTSEQCFSGTAEELSVTENTQPCLFCVDLAAARALEEAGVQADFAAGFSLGEAAALTFAGAFGDRDGFRFVCARAAAMQKAAEEAPGAMAAVLKLDRATVEALCGKFEQVWPVNYNCPGQIAVAGEKAALAAFCSRVGESGGRAVPLAVSGGFHSPLMAPAAGALVPVLADIPMYAPRLPVYANLTAAPYGGDMKETLLKQVKSPVRWQETLEALWAAGADTFIECGPGKTLTGLVKKTLRDAKALRVEDGKTLRETLESIA